MMIACTLKNNASDCIQNCVVFGYPAFTYEWPWLSFFWQVMKLKTDTSIHHRLNARSGWANTTANSGTDEFIVGRRGEDTYVSRPRIEKLQCGRPRTSQLSWFYYWQVVDLALLRLQSTILLVYSRSSLNRNLNVKSVRNIVPMALIIVLVWHFWNVQLHFTTRVFGHSANSPLLGGRAGGAHSFSFFFLM